MPLAEETSGNRENRLKIGSVVLPPFAFLGLLLLVAFGGENWVYSLPVLHENAQTLSISTDPFRGVVRLPQTLRPRAQVEVAGWIQSVPPIHQPQKITVYVDNQLVGETSSLLSSTLGSSTDGPAIQSWQLDFPIRDAHPGEHVLKVQAVLAGHDPITVAETSVMVTE